MNVIDCYVTKVLGKREETWDNGTFTLIEVEYDGYGVPGKTELVFKKGEEPEVSEGYHFLA